MILQGKRTLARNHINKPIPTLQPQQHQTEHNIMNKQNTNTRTIASACHTISTLWQTATTITLKLATPHQTHTSPTTHTRTTPALPIRERDMDTLTEVSSWLADAATALQMPRDVAVNTTVTDAGILAQWVADSARELAILPDGGRWAADASRYARRIKAICGESEPDSLRWRGALVEWQPERIAEILTQLTGTPVTGHRIRQAAYVGKIKPSGGRVILGAVANAVGL